MKKRGYVLLDRDGTLIVHRPYLSRPEQVEFLPRAIDGLREFQRLGFGVAVVTNQSGIGRGLFGWSDVDAVHATIRARLNQAGIEVGGFFVCPHRPEENCRCRKPKPGLAERAAQELDFVLADSVVIGDNLCDLDLGAALGLPTVLVTTGYGSSLATRGIAEQRRLPLAADLAEAAAIIAAQTLAVRPSFRV